MTRWLAASGLEIARSHSFGLIGIVNVTPDSFYDHCDTLLQAVDLASRQLAEGADVIDLGAESTRPGAIPVAGQEECRRLLPALEQIRNLYPGAIISVDTRNAATASLALQSGCAIINDVSACQHDPCMIDVLVQFRPGYVLTHTKGKPETMQVAPFYRDVVAEVKAYFEYWLNHLVCAGLPEDRVALDPGIGFGKTLAHNLAILSHIEEFMQFGRPLLLGVSMKAMLGRLLGLPLAERGEATATLSALMFAKGVIWHRVHEVNRVKNALLLTQALRS